MKELEHTLSVAAPPELVRSEDRSDSVPDNLLELAPDRSSADDGRTTVRFAVRVDLLGRLQIVSRH